MWGAARRSVAFAYRAAVRPWLPGRPVQLAGIPVCYDKKWGDRIFLSSWLSEMRLDDNPDYEGALVASLREAIRPGDRVAVIGGGVGVTAVIASLRRTHGQRAVL